jgi:carbonic anhydrase
MYIYYYTVRKWCEHGYTVAYEKTLEDLDQHFKHDEVFEERNFEEVEEDVQEVQEETVETQAVLEEESVPVAGIKFCYDYLDVYVCTCLYVCVHMYTYKQIHMCTYIYLYIRIYIDEFI